MQLATERTRILVEGVRTAITADVTRRRRDGMVVTQALPFLRLDTPVLEGDGTRARIARVAIAMEGDVPRLLLELVRDEPLLVPAPSIQAPYDAQYARRADKDADDTLESFTPGVSPRPARTDSTVPYDFQRSERETEVVAVREPVGGQAALVTTLAREPWWSALARGVRALLGTWLTALGPPSRATLRKS